MVTETVLTPGGPVVDDAAIQSFAAAFQGVVLRPGDGEFDAARHARNGMIDKTPALIARCAGVGDVIAAVNFARERQPLVAVRGGGHNVTGNAVRDRGLVIDLSRMNCIRVDPRGRTARAEGGETWGDLDRETQAFGLATTGGISSSTGVGGMTPGGGRLARPQARPRLRQPRRRRCRHRRRAPGDRQRDRERGPLPGPARRRRQLRRGHLARVPPPPGRADPRRHGAAPPRRRPGRAAVLPRVHAGRARGADHLLRAAGLPRRRDGATSVPPSGPARGWS